MTISRDFRARANMRTFSRAAALAVAVVGFLVIVGWALGVTAFKSVSPGLLTMKPNTAIALVLAGTSLWIKGAGGDRRRDAGTAAQACAAVVAILGALTLAEALVSCELRIDCLIFPDAPSAADPSPAGRMCPASALNLVFLGTSLLLLGARERVRASQILALLVALNAGVALLGYVFGAPSLYARAPYSSVALHTAVTMLAASLGVLAARPDQGLLAHLTSDTTGARSARRLLPAVILAPILLGRLTLAGERWGHFGVAMTTAIAATLSMAALTALVWWNAGQSHAIEEARLRSEERLTERTHELEALSTERALLLESERAARGEVERACRLKDEFVATVSHELRTPLHAIQGWVHLLDRPTADRALVTKGLAVIARNARQLTEIVSDLLDTSRIVSGKLHVELTPIDLPGVVDMALEELRVEATAKGVALDGTLAPLSGTVRADASRIRQVVQNLVSNAIKFTPRGGRVDVTLSSDGDHVTLRVRDTGKGIDPAFLPFMFDRFRQADASFVREHGGLGLGLAIVKHVAELHGGTIRASSEGRGKGTELTLTLPLTPAPSRREPRRDPPPVAAAGLSGITVLVVEDEPDARELAQRILEEHGASVVAAGSGHEALDVLAERTPDVLVSDISMPGMDGYELVHRLRAHCDTQKRAVPAVALTAFARTEDRLRAHAAGFQAHVTKPIEPAVLIAAVGMLCPSPSGDGHGDGPPVV